MKKILASLLVICILLCCGACAQESKISRKREKSEETEPSATVTVPSETGVDTVPVELPEEVTPEDTVPEQDDTPPHLQMYQELIDDYARIVQFRLSDDFREDWDTGVQLPALSDTMTRIMEDWKDQVYAMLYELPGYEADAEDFGYVLHDLNGDAMPELFWVRSDHSIVAIFTCHNDQPKLLETYAYRYFGYVGDNNTLYTWGANGAASSECCIMALTDGQLQEVFKFGTDEDYEGKQYYYEGTAEETFVTDWDRFEVLYDTYPETESTFWLTRTVYPLDHPVAEVSITEEKLPDRLPYLQKIQREDLSVWSGPGYDYQVVGIVGEAGTFTIVAEVGDYNDNIWGLLKSGAGWVDLTLIDAEKAEPPIVTANYADKKLLESGNYHYLKASDSEYTVQVAFRAHETLTDFEIYDDETGELLHTISTLEPGKPFVADLDFPGDMSMYDICFVDASRETHYYAVAISGRNNSLEFFEFEPW